MWMVGRDGRPIVEDGRALQWHGNDVDASGGRGLRPSWQRRPVCERLRDRVLDVEEIVSARVMARGEAKAVQRMRATAGEPAVPARLRRRGRHPRTRRNDLRRFGSSSLPRPPT